MWLQNFDVWAKQAALLQKYGKNLVMLYSYKASFVLFVQMPNFLYTNHLITPLPTFHLPTLSPSTSIQISSRARPCPMCQLPPLPNATLALNNPNNLLRKSLRKHALSTAPATLLVDDI